MTKVARTELQPVGMSLSGVAARALNFARSFDGLGLAVVWVSIAAARIVIGLGDSDLIHAIASVLALPLILLVPRFLGVLFWPLARSWRERLDGVEQFVVAWLAGMVLLILGLTLVTGVVQVPATVAAGLVLAVVTGAAMFEGFRHSPQRDARANGWRADLKACLPFVAALLLIAVPLVLIRVNQPYPLQVGWGLFSFNFRILEFTELDHIAIAPGLHTPIHASILGVSSILTGTETEGLIWATPFLLFASFGVGTFVLARRLLDNDLLALATVWVAVWILSLTTFRHLHGVGMRGVILAMWPWVMLVLYKTAPDLRKYGVVESGTRLLVPLGVIAGVGLVRWSLPSELQPWCLLVLAGGVYAIIRAMPEERRFPVGVLSVIAGSMTLIHIIEAPLYVAMGVAFMLLLSWRTYDVASRVVLAVGFAGVAAFIGIQMAGVLTFDDASIISRLLLGDERADAIPIPFTEKMSLFERGMTYTFMGILGFSALRLLVWPHPLHLASITAVSLAIFFYFVPESGLHRIMGPVLPLIGVCIALEAYWVANRLLAFRWSQPPLMLTGALVVVAMIALTPHLTSSLRGQLLMPSVLGFPSGTSPAEFSNVTEGEYDAAVWIRENTPQDWALVSDPTTMFYMQGLTLHDQVANKRAWVADSEYTEEDQARLGSLAPSVFGAATVDEALTAIDGLMREHPGYLLIISYRTLDWTLAPQPLFRLSKPREVVALEAEGLASHCEFYEIDPCLSRFFTSDGLSLIYNEGGVAIFAPTLQLSDYTAGG